MHRPLRTCGPVAHTAAAVQEDLFHLIFNRRLAAVSRQPGCPFYVAQSGTDSLMTTCATHNCSIMPLPGKTLEALETVLQELARLRAHGAEPVRTLEPYNVAAGVMSSDSAQQIARV